MTEDKELIAQSRKQLSEEELEHFVSSMTHFGYEKEELPGVVGRLILKEFKPMSLLAFENVSKSYGATPALENVSLRHPRWKNCWSTLGQTVQEKQP